MWRYVLTHWQGKQSLPRAALLNGVLFCLLLVFVLVGIGLLFNNNQVVVWLCLAAFFVWMLWALVGIFRCATRVALDPTSPTLTRIGGALAIVGVIVVVVVSIDDVRRLFGLF